MEDVDSFSGTTTGILKYQSSPYSVSNLAASGSGQTFINGLKHSFNILCYEFTSNPININISL